jgi:hypothetical protein
MQIKVNKNGCFNIFYSIVCIVKFITTRPVNKMQQDDKVNF